MHERVSWGYDQALADHWAATVCELKAQQHADPAPSLPYQRTIFCEAKSALGRPNRAETPTWAENMGVREWLLRCQERGRLRRELARMCARDFGDLAVPQNLITEELRRWPWQEPSPQWEAIARCRAPKSEPMTADEREA